MIVGIYKHTSQGLIEVKDSTVKAYVQRHIAECLVLELTRGYVADYLKVCDLLEKYCEKRGYQYDSSFYVSGIASDVCTAYNKKRGF